MKTITLPITNKYGYYEIRLESIGGLGANLCGKMLGELGLQYLGLNSASFSSYGSEKTGTPVKGFIRYSEPDKEIRIHSPIQHPHILAVFHSALLTNPATLEGCTPDTQIIINADPQDAPIGRAAHYINAQQIAIETKSRVNVVMLGAIARVMGFVQLPQLEAICTQTLGKKYPAALPGNLAGIRRGYQEVQQASVAGKMTASSHGPGIQWGYETAPIGGVNPHYGNTVVNDLSPSRQGYFPVFIPDKCIHCGLCDSTCPDMVFQFQKIDGKITNRGLDYYHCKGCLRCVDVCPVQALVTGREAEHPNKAYFLPNQELERIPEYYQKAGSDGYITSESFLTEKRVQGGEI